MDLQQSIDQDTTLCSLTSLFPTVGSVWTAVVLLVQNEILMKVFILLGIASHTDAVRVCQVFDEPQEHLRRNDVIYSARVEFVENELSSPRNRGTKWSCNRYCTFKCSCFCCHCVVTSQPYCTWEGFPKVVGCFRGGFTV